MIRIPGARLIPINFNPYSDSSACALVLKDGHSLQSLSANTGGSADDKKFASLADTVERAFENSPLRNKQHVSRAGRPIRLEPYQKLGAAFALIRRGRAGLFDPMGLGKTVQAIALPVICPDLYLPLVIVAPRNALGAWSKQLGGEGQSEKALEGAWVAPGALHVRIIRTHDELVQAAVDLANPKRTAQNIAYIIWNNLLTDPGGDKQREAAERNTALASIADQLSQRGLLVFDEAHYFRVPDSTMFSLGFMMAQRAAHVLALTGTPSLSAVTQTLPILALVARPNETIIPELRQFPAVTTGDDQTRADLWKQLQTAFVNRHIAALPGQQIQARRLPEQNELVDFKPYSREVAQSVENEFRQYAVRRSRRSVVEKTLDPPLAIGIGKKSRSLELVDVPATMATRLTTQLSKAAYFYERAGLIAKIDGVILNAVLENKLNASSTSADVLTVTDRHNTEVLPYLLEQFECATYVLRAGVGNPSYSAMGEIVRPLAVEHFSRNLGKDSEGNVVAYRPTVYFTHNIDEAKALAVELFKTYEKVSVPRDRKLEPNPILPQRYGLEVYLYTGSTKGRVQRDAKGEVVVRRPSDMEKDQEFLSYVAKRFEPEDFYKPRIFVSSEAGREGVDLPAGVDVVFVQRFHAPGLEEQAEDRINRANRHPNAPPPNVTYYMPEHFTSFVLLNRLERRRASALRTYGETTGDDFSDPLTFAYDQPTQNVRQGYMRLSFGAEKNAVRGYEDYLLNRLAWAVRLAASNPTRARDLRRVLTSNTGPYELVGLPTDAKRVDWCAEQRRRVRTPAAQPPAPSSTQPQAPATVRRQAAPVQPKQQEPLPRQAPAVAPPRTMIRRAGPGGPVAVSGASSSAYPVPFMGSAGRWSGVSGVDDLRVGDFFSGNHTILGPIIGRISRAPATAARGAVFFAEVSPSGTVSQNVRPLPQPWAFIEVKVWRPALRNPGRKPRSRRKS